MTFSRKQSRSPFMEFAKLHSGAKHNLAGSGMASYPLAELGVPADDLEINGPNAYGYAPLVAAISQRYRVPSECVVTATGTAMANYLAMAACADPGDEVLFEDPTYPLLLDTAAYLGLTVKRFKRRPQDFQIDLADLERNISSRTRLIVTCNLHNPSSALTPPDTLRRVGELAKAAGANVLVDEVYLEMLWQADPQSAVHLDPATFISTNSLTKAYGLSGLRCGWILAPPAIAERIRHINDLHGATPVFPGELMSVIAFRRLEKVAAHQRAVLEENRALLKEVLEGQDKLDYFWPPHGTVVFPQLKQGNADEFCERLRRDFDLTVAPGRFFAMPQHMRIGVGGSAEEVRAALAQLRKALST